MEKDAISFPCEEMLAIAHAQKQADWKRQEIHAPKSGEV